MKEQDKSRLSHLIHMLLIEERSPPGKPGGDPLHSPVFSPRITEIAEQARCGPTRLSTRMEDLRSKLSAVEPSNRSRPVPFELLPVERSTHSFSRRNSNSDNFISSWPYAPDSNRYLMTQTPSIPYTGNKGMRIGSPRPPVQYKATYLPFQT